jgi:hypothetical protein
MKLSNLFTPKSRQLTFTTTITVHSLDNVPMLSGNFYTKIKLPKIGATPVPIHPASIPSSASAPVAAHSGSPSQKAVGPPFSPRAGLIDHSAKWNWRYMFEADLHKGEDGVLLPWPFAVSVKKVLFSM